MYIPSSVITDGGEGVIEVIMTDRETPLAEIVGQMSLSQNIQTFRPNPGSSTV